MAVTPGGDLQYLDLDKVAAWRPLLANRRLPRGLRERDCYLIFFENRQSGWYRPAELKDMKEEAARLAALQPEPAEPEPAPDPQTGVVARRIPTKKPVPEVPPNLPPKPPGVDPVVVVIDPARSWYAMEAGGGYVLGATLRLPDQPRDVVRGSRALVEVKPGEFLLAKLLTDNEAITEFNRAAPAASGDARCLKVEYVGGRRHREFTTLAEDCGEEDFPDFPLTGPRTVSWCLTFLRRRRHPTDHHALWKTVTRLSSDSWGVAEHENLAHLLTLSAEYDQLDLSNLAWAEAALRRMQTIEWVYHDKVRENEQVAGDRISVEEMTAFSGTHKAGETVMICPSLLSHVRSQVESEVGIMKSVRKAREERDLRRKKKPGKGGGKGSEE